MGQELSTRRRPNAEEKVKRFEPSAYDPLEGSMPNAFVDQPVSDTSRPMVPCMDNLSVVSTNSILRVTQATDRRLLHVIVQEWERGRAGKREDPDGALVMGGGGGGSSNIQMAQLAPRFSAASTSIVLAPEDLLSASAFFEYMRTPQPGLSAVINSVDAYFGGNGPVMLQHLQWIFFEELMGRAPEIAHSDIESAHACGAILKRASDGRWARLPGSVERASDTHIFVIPPWFCCWHEMSRGGARIAEVARWAFSPDNMVPLLEVFSRGENPRLALQAMDERVFLAQTGLPRDIAYMLPSPAKMSSAETRKKLENVIETVELGQHEIMHEITKMYVQCLSAE